MFKKGQLVLYGGDYFIVGPVLERTAWVKHRSGFGEWVLKARLELIGNNYKAKQKCSH